jgi:hypothetical protein
VIAFAGAGDDGGGDGAIDAALRVFVAGHFQDRLAYPYPTAMGVSQPAVDAPAGAGKAAFLQQASSSLASEGVLAVGGSVSIEGPTWLATAGTNAVLAGGFTGAWSPPNGVTAETATQFVLEVDPTSAPVAFGYAPDAAGADGVAAVGAGADRRIWTVGGARRTTGTATLTTWQWSDGAFTPTTRTFNGPRFRAVHATPARVLVPGGMTSGTLHWASPRRWGPAASSSHSARTSTS